MARTSEDELRETLDQTAKGLGEMYGNPSSWGTWLVYLFEKLEAQASTTPANKEAFKDMLVSLQESLRNRMRTGGW